MRKIQLAILHQSNNVKKEISLTLKKNFPLIETAGIYNIKPEDIIKTQKRPIDLYLISSKIDLEENSVFINKIKQNSEFILLIEDEKEALLGFKHGAIDVIITPYTLEKLLFSINKFYWKFFANK